MTPNYSDSATQNQLNFFHCAKLLIPFGVLFIVLWFEAEVPNLPSFAQGLPITQALADSSKGQGLSGLFSMHSFFDVIRRFLAVVMAIFSAWILTRYAPAVCIRLYQKILNDIQNFSRKSFGFLLFLSAVVISLSFFGLVRGFTPRVGDEIAYLFQARLFSQGLLSMPAPEFFEFFDVLLVVNGPKWFSQYPPGHPFFLAPMMSLGFPWMVGPLMGGITSVSTWLLGAKLYDEKTGRLAGALSLVSPFFIYMSGSYLSHSTCLAMASLAALGLITAIHDTGRRSLLSALGGGTALGAVAMIRPLTAVGLALGLSFFAILAGKQAIKIRIRKMMIVMPLFVLSAAMISSLVLLYNLSTTGYPLKWGYELANPYPHDLGFGIRGHQNIDYTPDRALFNTRLRWRWMNGGFSMGSHPIPGGGFFFWPFPVIAVILGIIARGRPKCTDIALLFIIIGLASAYFFYYFLEMCWGSRFLYESSFALLLLTARGAIAIGEVAERFGLKNIKLKKTNTSNLFTGSLLLPAIFFAAMHIALPTGATQERIYDPVTWPTRGVDEALTRALNENKIERGLVFFKDSDEFGFYETAWRRMFVDQDKKIIFAKDLGPANQKLIAVYGSSCWIAKFNDDPWKPKFSIYRASKDFVQNNRN